jgi:hypothetical protein
MSKRPAGRELPPSSPAGPGRAAAGAADGSSEPDLTPALTAGADRREAEGASEGFAEDEVDADADELAGGPGRLLLGRRGGVGASDEEDEEGEDLFGDDMDRWVAPFLSSGGGAGSARGVGRGRGGGISALHAGLHGNHPHQDAATPPVQHKLCH